MAPKLPLLRVQIHHAIYLQGEIHMEIKTNVKAGGAAGSGTTGSGAAGSGGMATVQNNPIYTGSETAGENPLYNG